MRASGRLASKAARLTGRIRRHVLPGIDGGAADGGFPPGKAGSADDVEGRIDGNAKANDLARMGW
jgi:hypothetical protein